MEPNLAKSWKQYDELIRVSKLKRALAIYGLKWVNSLGEIHIWNMEYNFEFRVDVKELLVRKKGKWQYRDNKTREDVLAIRWLDKHG